MTGRLGKITKEIFRLLEETSAKPPAERRLKVHEPREPDVPRERERPGEPKTASSDPGLRRAAEIADRIEAELKRLRWWMDDPPSEETVVAGGAFGMNAVAFPSWLQVVFVKRLRQAAADAFPLPKSSQVSTFAIREFDGYPEDTGALMDLLQEVDRLV